MKKFFRPYRDCNVFIETGSAAGDGIVAALNAGFPIVHSVEVSDYYYNICAELFERNENVFLHHGQSTDKLHKILFKINEKCVFWLDAHWCGGATGGEGYGIPIMEELKIIANHRIKNHTILIDDMRLVRARNENEWAKFPHSIKDIVDFIMTINPNYVISFEDTWDSAWFREEILIARCYD